MIIFQRKSTFEDQTHQQQKYCNIIIILGV